MEQSGWICSGSFLVPSSFLPLGHGSVAVMTIPEPEKFLSHVLIQDDSGEIDSVSIEVNKPFKKDGFKLYQTSYDQEKGKWSTLSVLEAVKDPWLPAVYVGIFMLLAGAIYIFWIGNEQKK